MPENAEQESQTAVRIGGKRQLPEKGTETAQKAQPPRGNDSATKKGNDKKREVKQNGKKLQKKQSGSDSRGSAQSAEDESYISEEGKDAFDGLQRLFGRIHLMNDQAMNGNKKSKAGSKKVPVPAQNRVSEQRRGESTGKNKKSEGLYKFTDSIA